MKMKKKSIIIPAAALLIGASLAGSISGTVAWYQYSTRVNAAYVGLSGGADGNLQMRFDSSSDWAARITKEEVAAQLGEGGTQIVPVTPGAMDKDEAIPDESGSPLFYTNPIYGQSTYDTWNKASVKNYVSFPLQLRFVEHQTSGNAVVEKAVQKNIYLSELVLQKHSGAPVDISPAIRVHIENVDDGTYFLISKTAEEIDVGAALDLDGDGADDQAFPEGDKYGFNHDDSELEDIIYGEENGKQMTYAASELLVTPNDDLSLSNVAASKVIGKTVADGVLNLKITIWVEGWEEFNNNVFWSDGYIDSNFDVGFEFAVNPAEE